MLPTHTVTHTGKRTDGAHGAKSFRPHPFCGGNARKALYTNGRRAFYHLVRMRSAVRIRPAAPKRKPPGRVVFCFGKLRCGVEVYPRRGKSAQQLQQFPPKSKGLGGFCYIFATFHYIFEASKKTSLLKIGVLPTKRPTFWQMESQQSLTAQRIAVFCLSLRHHRARRHTGRELHLNGKILSCREAAFSRSRRV